MDGSNPHIGLIQHQLALGKAHRRRSITATATLVEHKRTVNFYELIDNAFSFWGDQYS